MRRTLVVLSALVAALVTVVLALGAANAAVLKPRVLDATIAPYPILRTLPGGTRVLVQWRDDVVLEKETALIVDVTTGRVVRTVELDAKRTLEQLGGGIRSAPGAVVVIVERTGGKEWDDPARIRDVIDDRVLAETLRGERVQAAHSGKDGLHLLTGGANILAGSAKTAYTLRLWQPGSTTPRWQVDVPSGKPADAEDSYPGADVTMSSDGRLITAIRDKALHLIDAATGTLRSVAISAGKVTGTGLSDDGARLYIATADSEVIVLSMRDLAEIRRHITPDKYVVRSVTEHVGGKILEYGGRRSIMFADPATGKFVRHDRGSSVNAYRLAWLGNGNILRASKSRRSPITYGTYSHRNRDFKLNYRRQWTGGGMGALSWSPNGLCYLMSGGGKTMILGPRTGGEVARLAVKGDGLGDAEFVQGGRTIIAPDGEGKLVTYDTPAQCHGPQAAK